MNDLSVKIGHDDDTIYLRENFSQAYFVIGLRSPDGSQRLERRGWKDPSAKPGNLFLKLRMCPEAPLPEKEHYQWIKDHSRLVEVSMDTHRVSWRKVHELDRPDIELHPEIRAKRGIRWGAHGENLY